MTWAVGLKMPANVPDAMPLTVVAAALSREYSPCLLKNGTGSVQANRFIWAATVVNGGPIVRKPGRSEGTGRGEGTAGSSKQGQENEQEEQEGTRRGAEGGNRTRRRKRKATPAIPWLSGKSFPNNGLPFCLGGNRPTTGSGKRPPRSVFNDRGASRPRLWRSSLQLRSHGSSKC